MPDDAAAPPAPAGLLAKIPKPVIYVGSMVLLIPGLIITFIIISRLPFSSPIFTLQDITVSSFNVSTAQPYRLSTTMQVTISSRNAMPKVAIVYENMDLYATYRNEQITYRYSLPVTFQEHKEVVVWSPYLEGQVETISPISGPVLMQDLNYGALLVLIKIEGRLKFRVLGGTLPWSRRLYGHCPALIQLGDMNTKKDFAVAVKEFKFQLVQNCYIEL